MTVYSGSTVRIDATILPLSAGTGKKFVLEEMNPYLAAVDQSSVAMDGKGNVSFEVKGLIPGKAVVRLSLEGYDIYKDVTVNVVERDKVSMPIANVASGSTVQKGTEIYLTCTTESATIYYTTDGSCPCDLATAKKYDGTPIVVNETMTIKAIAMKQDMEDSQIAEYSYIVEDDNAVETITLDDDLKIYPIPVRDKLNISAGGKTINNVTVVTINGTVAMSLNKKAKEMQLDVSSLTQGMYIVNVSTEDKTFSRKVLKIDSDK